MDQNALVNELVLHGRRFLEEFGRAYPIAIAFWMKDKDESRWHLHIASESFKSADKGNAYGEVIRSARHLEGVPFDATYVRLERMDEKIVRWAIDYQLRHPGLSAVFDVPGFYGAEIEGMYLYPPLKTAA